MKAVAKVILLVIFMLITAVFSLIILPWVNRIMGSPVTSEVVLRYKYFNAMPDHALVSLLEITEQNTGKQIGELLALGVYKGKKTITVDRKTLNLNEIIDQNMIFLVSNRAYYLSAGNLEFGDREVVEKGYCSSTLLTLVNLEKKSVKLCLG